MAKLKHIEAYERNSCPDHLVQEVDELMQKMADALMHVLRDVEPNIILSAFNRMHAAMIMTLISERKGELKNATIQEVKGLVGNIEDISGVTIIKELHDP